MEMKQLHYFCTIVEEGQITRAAKKLHMAQPPLSQQLRQLEEEFGVKLFERNGRSLELTGPGRILYKRAKDLLAQAADAAEEVKETAEGVKGVLSAGANKSCFAQLAEKIRIFREAYPFTSFKLREGDTFAISELLKQREIEIGIVRLPLPGEEYSMLMLPAEPYVFVLPKEWHHAPGPSITLEEMARFPLLLLHRINGAGQFELIMNEFKKRGLSPEIVCECPDPSMLLSLAANGVGATIVPKSTLQSLQMTHMAALEIEGEPLISESALIWLKDRYLSKGARRLIDIFQNTLSLKV
ncbi:LysR family transcriptional regulator [Metabacillus sp. GX 13764]|uniref:LysR family transcriptional regulator n=1 Tax=Metabacillus kandeliae TaxID=2900151 RepID=UPI001E61194F|nr:LysR family transcriptional regulator [Metabacillus kandeliae]MCD7036056.1 LysR family transcriptional regulator [Metabacillus kandeliae]